MANTADHEVRDQIATVLHEYGEAIRGDWGSIDGRSERSSIQRMAGWVRDLSTFPDTLDEARDQVGICLDGEGHWQSYCRDSWTACTWWERAQ